MSGADADTSSEVCRLFSRKGECRFGDKCKYSHDVPAGGDASAAPAGRGECFNFAEHGSCKFEEKCRYRHGADDARFDSEGKRVGASEDGPRRRRRGGGRGAGGDGQPSAEAARAPRAARAERAPRAERTTERAPRERAPRTERVALPTENEAGERLCGQFVRNGSCGYGAECKFSHNLPKGFVRPAPKERAAGSAESGDRARRPRRRGPRKDGDGSAAPAERKSAPRSTAAAADGDDGGDGRRRRKKGPGLCHQFAEKGSCEYADKCRFKHGTSDSRDFAALRRSPNACFTFRDTGSCKYEDRCRFSHEEGAPDDRTE